MRFRYREQARYESQGNQGTCLLQTAEIAVATVSLFDLFSSCEEGWDFAGQHEDLPSLGGQMKLTENVWSIGLFGKYAC